MKLFLLVIFTVLITSIEAQKKAVLVLLDGIPADVIEKVKTPVLDEIAKSGGYTRAYVGGEIGQESETPTISAPGYMSLITGTWGNKHNVWGNDVKAPNYDYWNIFRIVKSFDRNKKTAIFSTWEDNRTKLIGEGLPESGDLSMDYAFDGFENDLKLFPHDEARKYIFNIDEHVSKEAARYIGEVGPDISWIYLEYTDDMGHMFGDSREMYEAVESADAQVGRIWSAIKKRASRLSEEWLIVITTDHGRTLSDGKGHGGQSERERTTWIVTNSNQLNSSFEEFPAIVDILPSVLVYMNLIAPAEIEKNFDGLSFIRK